MIVVEFRHIPEIVVVALPNWGVTFIVGSTIIPRMNRAGASRKAPPIP